LATAQCAALKPEKKPYHNLVKIDLVWRNLSEGALYAGLSNRASSCYDAPESSSLHVFSSPAGERAPMLCDTLQLHPRSGALACDLDQQNDKRQAGQPEQNPNRNPTHGFRSLSVMGRFRRMRRLCNVHLCSVLSKKDACTSDSTCRRRLPFWRSDWGDFWGYPESHIWGKFEQG
jgi:hypothetical protein